MNQLLSSIILVSGLASSIAIDAAVLAETRGRTRYNFNSEWFLHVGDQAEASQPAYKMNRNQWQPVTLPNAFNEAEAFKLAIDHLSDSVMWYRKTFRLPKNSAGKKVFLEFEGVRQAAEVYVNGQKLILHENGVMAFGLDVTDVIDPGKENTVAVRVDNDWYYREKGTDVAYQWNNKNFNANYGGIPKNVYLHVTDRVYQTLPLYNGLQTTGVYVFGKDIDIPGRKTTVHAESQVRNESDKPRTLNYEVEVFDKDGKPVTSFTGAAKTVQPGETTLLAAEGALSNVNFWSWGYGYLYTVATRLKENGKVIDEVHTRTGFRKTKFGEGKVWLNDRVIQMKGYAQRTSNEWPGVGISIPAWLSDYSNHLMVESNANLVRWMHVTPSKQDVESCDRVGLIQAMPAGDAEKDSRGRQWEHRVALMREAIIYNRNNPSILFYECGNESISREHMLEMIALRNQYDPQGGRAIGSREMLDIDEAEYGGEMLYINKSAKHPMWAMEYSRDEGLRKYWDEYSFPYHKEGDGPLYRNQDASVYNHNQDQHAIENIARWYDYWVIRPGTGKRVSSGGVNIIFSDTNTHFRGAENYRRSGETDAMRIPKDGFFAHQVMWDGWVDVENPRTHLMGHWNYAPSVVKPVYAVSSADKVELLLNGRSLGFGKCSSRFLFTFDSIRWEPGELKAIGYDNDGVKVSEAVLQTVGEPATIRLTEIESPVGLLADGADMVMVEFEVLDAQGRRCPLANNMINFELDGPAQWCGGIAQGPDNYIGSLNLPVECGVNRALIRATTKAGKINLKASAEGLSGASLSFVSKPVKQKSGLSMMIPGDLLPVRLERGATPATPSYKDTKWSVDIVDAYTVSNKEDVRNSFDDNELSEWRNDGKLATASITYKLAREAVINEVSLKLTGWRMRSYPIEVLAGDKVVYSGDTPKSLGYVYLPLEPCKTDRITIRLKGNTSDQESFGQITELDPNQELDLYKDPNADKIGGMLRIVEIDLLTYENNL